MKTININPGWYSALVIFICFVLALLMNSCDCKSDDGIIIYDEGMNAVMWILSFILFAISVAIILIVEDLKDQTASFLLGLLFMTVAIGLLIVGVWNASQIDAINTPMFEKQYIYKQLNYSIYVITDSIYIRL